MYQSHTFALLIELALRRSDKTTSVFVSTLGKILASIHFDSLYNPFHVSSTCSDKFLLQRTPQIWYSTNACNSVFALRFRFKRLYEKQNMMQRKQPNSGDLLPRSVQERSRTLRLGRNVFKMSQGYYCGRNKHPTLHLMKSLLIVFNRI